MTAERQARPEISVGAVVVVHGHLLLIERGREPARGQWSVPGGRVEFGETLTQAVVREVAEETGLNVVCGALLGMVERMSASYHHVILDYQASPVERREALPVLTAADDAAAAAWVALDEVATLPLVDGLLAFLEDHGILRAI